jgi:thymidylate synthase (FAD)
MAEMKFHVRVPMDCWRQWIRHRTANVNEYSTRYSEAIDECAVTGPDKWRLQSKDNKQGSQGFLDHTKGVRLTQEERDFHDRARSLYEVRLQEGVAREQARKDLPLSNYTEAYWKCDLHNLLGFLRLRLDKHAQLEIREYAEAIAGFVAQRFPVTWEAFQDYVINAVTFSGPEIEALRTGDVSKLSQREIVELSEKSLKGWRV